MSRPAVSQHLKVLRDAGVIRASREGRFVWYELDGEALVQAEHWLRSLVDTWAQAPARRTPSPAAKEVA
jgi:DNA-binding transcriptional ArsR family regulator